MGRRHECRVRDRLLAAHADLLERYPAVLATAVDALGESLPAPPYVVVTGTGPVLRASLPSGRLVVRLEVFALERDPERYVRTGESPDEILEIERR